MKNNDLKPYGTYLNMLAHKYDKGQVFEDFLQIIVCCLQMGRAEELYFKTFSIQDICDIKIDTSKA